MGLFDNVDTTKNSNETEFKPIPQGKYRARLTGADGDIASGSEHLNLEYTITQGEFENRKVWKRYFLNPDSQYHASNLEIIAGDLLKYNISLSAIENVEGIITAMYDKQGMEAEIFVKPKTATNGKVYTNVYLNDVFRTDKTVDQSGGVSSEFDKNQDVPF